MTTEHHYDALLRAATEGKLNRRAVLKRGVALGLSAPAIAAILAACGSSDDDEGESTSSTGSGTGSSTSTSTTSTGSSSTPSSSSTTEAGGEAGGAGEVRLLWWQAPTILNPHLSQGTKDFDASLLSLEPLASFNADSKMVLALAAEEPTTDNGMVAKDGMSVTWKLREGVKWHDGEPFTAKDVKFTFEYLSDPKTAATTFGSYVNVDSVDVVDDHTVKVNFKAPEPSWFTPFVGGNGMILPEHIMKDFTGEKSRTAPFNLKPVGTGPFKIVDFKPGDVGQWERNPDYWDKGKPHFDTVTMKGGGEAASAARAVLQTGEVDYAWNIQVEPNIIQSMEKGGQGKVQTWPGGGSERLLLNHSDPQMETNGEKSYYKNPHPHFKVKEVRQALTFMIDKDTIAKTLYGPGGDATALTLNNNKDYMPTDLTWEFNVDKAKQLLDTAGAKPGGDGIRELNGRKLSWLYQTSVNSVRQKTQEIIKSAAKDAGVDMQLKSIDAGVYFSGDAGNNDTTGHFYADLEMYTNSADIFPVLWYRRYYSGNPDTDICQKSNSWAADNDMRYQNPDFNKLWEQVKQELDPDKATDLFLQMQRMVVTDVAEIGIISRNNVACVIEGLTGNKPGPWTYDTWDLKDWTKSKS